jgi:hypothetical protein
MTVPVKVQEDRRNTATPYDSKDILVFLHRLQELSIWQAKIKKISEDHTDEYIADIYTTRSQTEADSQYKDIKIYEPDINNTYLPGTWVECYLDNNLIGLILPRRLPKGQGRCKALMLIDDANPGTPDWDYFAFQ